MLLVSSLGARAFRAGLMWLLHASSRSKHLGSWIIGSHPLTGACYGEDVSTEMRIPRQDPAQPPNPKSFGSRSHTSVAVSEPGLWDVDFEKGGTGGSQGGDAFRDLTQNPTDTGPRPN